MKTCVFFPGPLRAIIFQIFFGYTLISFLVVEIYIKFVAFTQHSDATKKSDLVALAVVMAFGSQFFFDYMIPLESKGVQYHTFKVFYNNVVYTIFVPGW